jgi:LuxR family transcriptional regulator, maltose regulon positive regulatory protein
LSVRELHLRTKLDVLEAKLRRPALRPGAVAKTALVSRLRNSSSRVVTVVAPAGYGKTTLLAQWAAVERRPVVWVSIDARDNDVLILLKHLIAAVDRIEPLDPRLLQSLGTPVTSKRTATIARAMSALLRRRKPILFVLDDVDLLRSQESRDVLSTLVEHSPRRTTLALGARALPKLRLAGLRAKGELQEVGVAELALSSWEAKVLLRDAGADLDEAEEADLVERCEGWPAALYLGCLSRRDQPHRPAHFAGDDRYLAEYIRTEYLSHLRPRELRFLRRASALDVLSGSLCDAVLQEEGSARELGKIARANLFLVRIERARGWYRFHPLFRDVLHRELIEEEPEVIAHLHRRACEWYQARGQLEAALKHADAAGDMKRAAALISRLAFPLSFHGRVASVEEWLAHFDPASLEGYPTLAVHGSRIHAMRGRAAEAERWLQAAEEGVRRDRRHAAALAPALAVVRAALCRQGPRRMRLDAELALRKLRRGSQWRPSALLLRGTAAVLAGEDEAADGLLGEAAAEAAAIGSQEAGMVALSERSSVARALGDEVRADRLAEQAMQLGNELDGYPSLAAALAASAETALKHGRWAEARELVTAARACANGLNESLPWLAVGVRLELAGCYLTLRDVDAARELAAEIDEILEARPDLGVLVDRAQELRRTLAEVNEERKLGLTPAEERLLPLLATHLSFREIAEELHVSRNTVKTQAISIYRKLGVSGRSDAIAAARRLDPTAVAA